MAGPSQAAHNMNWLLNNLVAKVPGVQEALVVSTDGLPMAASDGLDQDSVDRLAAVAAGLIGLSAGASSQFGFGTVNEVIVEMEQAFLFVTGVSEGSLLATVADGKADIGLVGYEMAVLVNRTREILTPALRAELRTGASP